MEKNNQLFDKLLAEYFSNEISPEDKETLFNMVNKSAFYKEQFEKANKLNALLTIPYFESHKNADYRELQKKGHIYGTKYTSGKKSKAFQFFSRVAAILIFMVISSITSIHIYKKYSLAENPTTWVETSTPLGGQTKIILPDGSTAWINAKSNLKYSSQFGNTDRNIYLDGEAFFEVKKKGNLPFSVQSGNMKIVATGTQFNVRSYPDDNIWEVDLLEGGVNVLISDNSYMLTPDEKVIFERSGFTAKIEKTDAFIASQWTKGKLFFHQASIPEIYKMLERHFNTNIQIECEELKKELFLGSINLDMSLTDILKYLDVDNKYKIEINNHGFLVKKR